MNYNWHWGVFLEQAAQNETYLDWMISNSRSARRTVLSPYRWGLAPSTRSDPETGHPSLSLLTPHCQEPVRAADGRLSGASVILPAI